jgi:hypothetical protein
MRSIPPGGTAVALVLGNPSVLPQLHSIPPGGTAVALVLGNPSVLPQLHSISLCTLGSIEASCPLAHIH